MRHKTQTFATFSALLLGLAASAESPPSSEMMAAMQRDLGLSEAQVRQRLAVASQTPAVEARLREALKDAFAGAWLSPGGTHLVVGITDRSLEALVRQAGAEPRVVTWSLAQLEEAKAALDRDARRATQDIQAWYVDPATNSVVVVAKASTLAESQARAFIDGSGATSRAVRIETSKDTLQLFENLVGGDAYYTSGGGRCSIGFPVKTGFVTAGHCGGAGVWTYGYNWWDQGVFQGSSFPGNDLAYVETNPNWTPTPWVTTYGAGGMAQVTGSQERGIYDIVCRSGSTTGWHCGWIQGKNATVNYPEGTVYGLTRTNACSEPGDSGGSFISGSEAQGVTSGGSGNCTSGGTTYFQPINPILTAYKLSLTTARNVPQGFNTFATLHSGMCLDVNGANGNAYEPLVQHACHYAPNQQFQLIDRGSGYYQIKAAHSGLCLDVYGANSNYRASVLQYPCHEGANQQFYFEPVGSPGNDVFRIRPRHSWLCLDVDGANSTNGARVLQNACHGGANQQFVMK